MRPESRSIPGLVEALPDLRSTLERDGSPRNRVRVAEALWMAGHPEAALSVLLPLVGKGGGGVAPHVLMGWCYEDLGRPVEAGQAFSAVRSLDPANPFAARDPHEATERQAEPEAALSHQELAEVPPSPLYSATLGEIFEGQGFEDKALEIYREIVRLHPDREDLRLRIDRLTRREDDGGNGR